MEDIPALPKDARDILAFTSQTFDGHIRAVGAWQAEIGVRQAVILQRIAELKHGTPPSAERPSGVMGRNEFELLLRRRRAEVQKSLLDAKAEGAKHHTEKYIEAEIQLDPQAILFEKKLLEMDCEIAFMASQFETIKYSVAAPLETTVKMLLAYSGQARVEKESYNAQRGRA